MNQKQYETIYILRGDLTEENEKKVQDRIAEIVVRHQGRIESAKDLGKKPLAYRIAKHTKGHYFQLNFFGSGLVVDELERHLRLTEDVIRFLTVRFDGATSVVAQDGKAPNKREAKLGEVAA